MFRLLGWVLLFASLGLPRPGGAQQFESPLRDYPRGIVMATRAELAPVDARELLLGGPAQALAGLWKGRLAPPGFPGTQLLRRELPALWQLRVGSEEQVRDLDVHYEITSPEGQRNSLRHSEDHSSQITVRLIEQPPVVVRTESDHSLVQGGVTLELQVGAVRYAGKYQGTLTVTVNQL